MLDGYLNPKLADFGFALELPKLSHGTTVFAASFIARSDGYFPSEITSGTFSDRSDIFSYGIVSQDVGGDNCKVVFNCCLAH